MFSSQSISQSVPPSLSLSETILRFVEGFAPWRCLQNVSIFLFRFCWTTRMIPSLWNYGLRVLWVFSMNIQVLHSCPFKFPLSLDFPFVTRTFSCRSDFPFRFRCNLICLDLYLTVGTKRWFLAFLYCMHFQTMISYNLLRLHFTTSCYKKILARVVDKN